MGTSDMPGEPVAWRCFHCDEVFTDVAEARLHFGEYEMQEPICLVTAERYREVERQLQSYRDESDAQSRFFYEMGSKHHAEIQRAEEHGYEKGLRDGVRAGGPFHLIALAWHNWRVSHKGAQS